jgi:hypothetical protein
MNSGSVNNIFFLVVNPDAFGQSIENLSKPPQEYMVLKVVWIIEDVTDQILHVCDVGAS